MIHRWRRYICRKLSANWSDEHPLLNGIIMCEFSWAFWFYYWRSYFTNNYHRLIINKQYKIITGSSKLSKSMKLKQPDAKDYYDYISHYGSNKWLYDDHLRFADSKQVEKFNRYFAVIQILAYGRYIPQDFSWFMLECGLPYDEAVFNCPREIKDYNHLCFFLKWLEGTVSYISLLKDYIKIYILKNPLTPDTVGDSFWEMIPYKNRIKLIEDRDL